jgi:hypothetical protein
MQYSIASHILYGSTVWFFLCQDSKPSIEDIEMKGIVMQPRFTAILKYQ